ncbi:MAG: response regulator [Bacteroidaceae bacterium]|nr:response regulator [Bacteroidaceae bacterium]
MMYKSILVIDDNEGVRISLKYLLKKTFENVITLDSPENCLQVLEKQDISIVILDMNFSLGLNTGNEGLFWLDKIKKSHPKLPVILFTAYGDIELAVRGVKAGASDFVVKPWDNTKLMESIRNAFEKQQEIRPLAEIEVEHIRNAIDKCGGNMKLAAELLGVSRQTIYNKLNSFN